MGKWMIGLLAAGFLPPFFLLVLVSADRNALEDELKKHPTYHCDGATTMGYAVPGTPEAAACWIEGGEK